MAKSTLVDTLYERERRFIIFGKAVIQPDTFAGVTTSKSGYSYVRDSISIDTGENGRTNIVIQGGYSKSLNVIKKQSQNGKYISIPYDDIYNPKWTEKDSDGRLPLRANAYYRFTDGKETKTFLSEIDFTKHLEKHLENGQEIVAFGNVEYYTRSNGATGYLLHPSFVSTDIEKHKPKEFEGYGTEFRQSYLVDSDSISKTARKDLENDGETLLRLYVPQYTAQKKVDGEYISFKKIIPYPVAVNFHVNEGEEIDAAMKRLELLFKVGKNKVRELTLRVMTGSKQEASAGIEISKELQELIDQGIITKESVEKSNVARGTYKPFTSFVQLYPRPYGGDEVKAFNDDFYSPDVLVVPMVTMDNSTPNNPSNLKPETPKLSEDSSNTSDDDDVEDSDTEEESDEELEDMFL